MLLYGSIVEVLEYPIFDQESQVQIAPWSIREMISRCYRTSRPGKAIPTVSHEWNPLYWIIRKLTWLGFETYWCCSNSSSRWMAYFLKETVIKASLAKLNYKPRLGSVDVDQRRMSLSSYLQHWPSNCPHRHEYTDTSHYEWYIMTKRKRKQIRPFL